MSEHVTDKPVCVTGASGFIASHLVEQLLERGYRVRGTVRDAANASKVEHLTSLTGADERLELVSANLLEPESFKDAVAGCQYVHHTASPYVIDVKDPDADLVQPAVRGTLAVMNACREAGSVKRVILTSSMAAVTDQPDSAHVLTESDWNEKSSLKRNPYYYSKVKAERAAWDEVEAADFDLVVVNPFLVVGPSKTSSLNPSNEVIANILNKKVPAIVSLTWGFVDVRDVALSHVRAMEMPDAEGRYLCANVAASMREVVGLLGDLGDHKLPSTSMDHAVGNWIVKLGSYFQPKGTGSYLRSHVGRVPRFDNSKIKRDLEIEFRPLLDTLRDTVADLERWGHA